jgi:hypothetical protein
MADRAIGVVFKLAKVGFLLLRQNSAAAQCQ